MSGTLERETRKQRVLEVASNEALKYGLVSTAVATIGTVAATMRSQRFNKFTSLSVKLAIPIMTGLAFWSFKYEVVVKDAILYPERWGVDDGTLTKVAAKKVVNNMPLHHQAMNYIYDHPFQFVASLGIPLATTILYQQKHNTHLTFSQKIMHSRVFAQGGTLAILLTTMGFREYMDRNGRFTDPSAEPVKEQSEEEEQK
mmetsp:Transcript_19042/g.20641  ORF Transcript_19042/g.20641 Transcript_19042/m.20641 type:complete len:200 (-) Transcript_19042:58-657(-)|eukprot:gene10717-11676_t